MFYKWLREICRPQLRVVKEVGMIRFLSLLSVLAFVNACTPINTSIPKEAFDDNPTLAPHTSIQNKLKSLPPAAKKITVSVYQFSDQTGQMKPGAAVSYSRAVTQGGLAILKKALMDASEQSWFRVLERGGLQNLLQERKIIRSVRSDYTTPDGRKLSPLSPLLYSGVLLEGGIISYESNVLTGGLGARYLGIGGSAKYSRDMVTVYLRAISVKSGEVLVNVNSSKTIYSQGLDGGIFKYVSFDELVEGEAGFTLNEPPQLAVRQAIEMSVYALIMEGHNRKLWNFENPSLGQIAYSDYVKTYHPEKAEQESKMAKAVPAMPAKERKMSMTPSPRTSTQKTKKLALNSRSSKSPSDLSTNSSMEGAQKVQTSNEVSQRAKRKPPTPTYRVAKTGLSYEKSSGTYSKQGSFAKPRSSAGSRATTLTQTKRSFESLPLVANLKDLRRGWYVEIMKTSNLGNKEKAIIDKFRRAGFETYAHKSMQGTRATFTILVGSFSNRRYADSVRDSIKRVSRQVGVPLLQGTFTVTHISVM